MKFIRSSRLGGLPLLLAGVSLAACSSVAPERPAPAASEHVASSASAVIKGKNSDKSQDAVVLLVFFEQSSGQVAMCTGTLLSDRVVLTARHCVADTDEAAACDVDGKPVGAGSIRGNHAASSMFVFVGPNRPDFNAGDVKPDGVGSKIVDDGGKNLCNHDIALVVLKEPIANAKIAPIRLDASVKKGEKITAVGWGVTDTTDQPDIRQQRTGIPIIGVGPDDTDSMPVPPNEFEIGEGICSGDSGGPAFASTGAVLGVVSRGGNGKQPDPQDPSSGCIGGENLYTKVAPFKELIESTLQLVDAEPWYEGGADPRLLKPGSVCGDASECRSNLCVVDPSVENATTCAQDCSSDPCPDDQTCTTVDDAQVCRVPVAAPTNAATSTATKSGCATGTGSPASSGAVGLLLAALGLVALRRGRR